MTDKSDILNRIAELERQQLIRSGNYEFQLSEAAIACVPAAALRAGSVPPMNPKTRQDIIKDFPRRIGQRYQAAPLPAFNNYPKDFLAVDKELSDVVSREADLFRPLEYFVQYLGTLDGRPVPFQDAVKLADTLLTLVHDNVALTEAARIRRLYALFGVSVDETMVGGGNALKGKKKRSRKARGSQGARSKGPASTTHAN
ncbi:hypothetical protein GGH96_000365 [Coemansia sp. RSA 1972]|nr:hypothetical protein GGH96_000365 [Coemansia sp. RSA 1972]